MSMLMKAQTISRWSPKQTVLLDVGEKFELVLDDCARTASRRQLATSPAPPMISGRRRRPGTGSPSEISVAIWIPVDPAL